MAHLALINLDKSKLNLDLLIRAGIKVLNSFTIWNWCFIYVYRLLNCWGRPYSNWFWQGHFAAICDTISSYRSDEIWQIYMNDAIGWNNNVWYESGDLTGLQKPTKVMMVYFPDSYDRFINHDCTLVNFYVTILFISYFSLASFWLVIRLVIDDG